MPLLEAIKQALLPQRKAEPRELYIPLDTVPSRMGSLSWFVCQTKSRMEKQLARYLSSIERPYFLPMLARKNASRNTYLSPLFSGFIFVSYEVSGPANGLDPTNTFDMTYAQEACRTSQCAFGFLLPKDQPLIRKELALLSSETAYSRTLKLETQGLPKLGQYVRVRQGPSEGMRGFICPDPKSQAGDQSGRAYDQTGRAYSAFSPEEGAKRRLYVQLSLLGQLVSVEFPLADLELV